MKAIIPVAPHTVGLETIPTVNARDLHSFLAVGKDFTNWIKDQIVRARLVENRDFAKLAEKGELSRTGQTRTEYHLTIEAGKHIAMLSGTDKGFEVREYFIECERRAKQPAIPADPIIMLRLEQLSIQEKVSDLDKRTAELEDEKDILYNELDATRRMVFELQDRPQVKLTIGNLSNPITMRLHSKGLTIRQWADKHNFDYNAVRNVISGLSQKEAIRKALDVDGLLSEDLF